MQSVLSKLDDLRSLVGAERVCEREGKVIASPRTTEEVAGVTRYANEHRLAIEIVGAGTKRGWGDSVAAEILLETRGLAGVRSHSWQDLTATVAAGTTWAAMQRELAVHGQFVALDPLWPEIATAGGIVATNDSGALRLKYGSLRDLIIGMTIVLADGTIAKTGGKVVKNVAGYDLHKLMTGAFGTLGVIADVTFRLHPLPKHSGTTTVFSSDVMKLAPLLRSIGSSRLLTEGLQLRGGPEGHYLDVQLGAHPDAKHGELLQEMIAAGDLTPSLADDAWKKRELLVARPNRLILKATMLPQEIPAFAQEVEEKGGEYIAQSLGIMCASFPTDELSFKLAEEFRYHVRLQGGTTSLMKKAAFADSAEKWATIAEGEPIQGLSLMREIKKQFDPNRVLNPGCFVGGI